MTTLTKVAALKKEARQLVKAEGIKQTAALAKLAHREGFSSWETLMATVGKADEVRHAIKDAGLHGGAQ